MEAGELNHWSELCGSILTIFLLLHIKKVNK